MNRTQALAIIAQPTSEVKPSQLIRAFVAADMQWAGHFRKAHELYAGNFISWQYAGQKAHCSWGDHNVCGWVRRASYQDCVRIAKFIARYRQFRFYMLEVSPQWTEVDKACYADNSVYSCQVDKNGNKREVCVTAAGGDLCF